MLGPSAMAARTAGKTQGLTLSSGPPSFPQPQDANAQGKFIVEINYKASYNKLPGTNKAQGT